MQRAGYEEGKTQGGMQGTGYEEERDASTHARLAGDGTSFPQDDISQPPPLPFALTCRYQFSTKWSLMKYDVYTAPMMQKEKSRKNMKYRILSTMYSTWERLEGALVEFMNTLVSWPVDVWEVRSDKATRAVCQ